MHTLGKTDVSSADQFVQENVGAALSSLTLSGLRRVTTDAKGEELDRQRKTFELIAFNDMTCEEPVTNGESMRGGTNQSKNSQKRNVCAELKPLRE